MARRKGRKRGYGGGKAQMEGPYTATFGGRGRKRGKGRGKRR